MVTNAIAQARARRVLLTNPIVQSLGLRIPQTLRLTGGSVKIDKGVKVKVLTTVLYLAPADESGIMDVCPFATPECRAACLGHSSGQMVFDSSRNARAWKTALYKFHKREFWALLNTEILAHKRKAWRFGYLPAVRLDGTSDLGLARAIAPQHPDVQFYDYTKSPLRVVEAASVPNWYVLLSYSGHNLDDCLRVLACGFNVAVVFATKDAADFPDTWNGYHTVNADDTDARFYDPAGTVAALTFKGGKLEEAGCFAVPV